MDRTAKPNFVEVDCPLCQSQSSEKVYFIQHFNDNILPKIGVNPPFPPTYIQKCMSCGHHYACPQLFDEALDKYYSEVNSEYYIGSETNDKLLVQHQFVVSEIEKTVTSGKVLEIGCGCGYLLHLFNPDRWEAIGVEPFGEAYQFAKERLGLNIVHGYLDANTFPNKQSFDIIMLFDVMEHLKDPVSMMDLVNHYLKPGGLLVMGTGDISSVNAKISGERWAYLTLREHVSFFSRRSMKYLLRQFESVDIRAVSYSGNSLQNLTSFLNNHLIRRAYNLFQSVQYPITKIKFSRFPKLRYLLAHDHMLVIARKAL